MVLVDTNVLFSLVLENDLSASAMSLYQRDDDWHSEPHVFVELTNVLVRYVRNRLMGVEEARLALARAESVVAGNLHPVLHADALDSALRYQVSAYDARFLVAAEAFETKLVTEDLKLRSAAPVLTRSLAQALQ